MTKDSISNYRTKVKGYKNASSPVDRVCGRIPRIPPESATVGVSSSINLKLIGREIIFEVFQRVKNISERHGRRDGRTDDLLWHNRALHSIAR